MGIKLQQLSLYCPVLNAGLNTVDQTGQPMQDVSGSIKTKYDLK